MEQPKNCQVTAYFAGGDELETTTPEGLMKFTAPLAEANNQTLHFILNEPSLVISMSMGIRAAFIAATATSLFKRWIAYTSPLYQTRRVWTLHIFGYQKYHIVGPRRCGKWRNGGSRYQKTHCSV
jgi:hypothetical protein